uniref:Essential for reactive oxygen species protein n=1 Tax=Equus asinus asinus TaxID=83772 RepID=A0A8C4PIJ2_EQUAS
MYMQVETRTSSCLHLKRAPGIRSWSLLVGILSIGLAAAYYSGDSLGWKLFYVTGCLFVAVQNLEDWEEAIFNKSTGKVVLKTFSLYKKLLTLSRAGHDQVVVLLNDIRDVNVEEEKVRYFGKGYVVVLRFATGFSHPLTQSAVMGHRSPTCRSSLTPRGLFLCVSTFLSPAITVYPGCCLLAHCPGLNRRQASGQMQLDKGARRPTIGPLPSGVLTRVQARAGQ